MIMNSKTKDKIPIKDLENLYVISDFDRTITSGSSKTSWSILANSNLLPHSYASERKKLYEYYRPIEISDTVDYEYKLEMMREWYQKHIELFIKYQITEKIFNEAATNFKIMEFRPYAKEFIKFLYNNQIPLIIISAGIGNFIESFLKENNCYYDNIYIISNKVIFKDGMAVGIGENIIHSLNKNEIPFPSNILEKIKNRNNVILLGDQISDLNMLNKKSYNSLLTIGLLTSDSPKNMMISNYDIVCEEDDDYMTILTNVFNYNKRT